MTRLCPIRRPPSLGHYMAVPYEHKAVHRFDRIDGLDKRQHAGRRHSLTFRRAAGKLRRATDRSNDAKIMTRPLVFMRVPFTRQIVSDACAEPIRPEQLPPSLTP